MTPKEKAKELIDSFESYVDEVEAVDGGEWNNCRLVYKSVKAVSTKCALNTANEVLALTSTGGFLLLTEYWTQVKEEIFIQYEKDKV